jgi:uncharacterized membrane protein
MDWLGALIVFLLAPLPLIEIRVSTSLGLLTYHLGASTTYLLVVVSNLLFIPLAWSLRLPVERMFRRSRRLSAFLDRLYARARKETSHRREVLEELGMFVIVALVGIPFPLPGSGIYTAMIVAHIFGLPMKKVFPWIAAGVLVATAGFMLLVVAGKAVFT